MTRRSLLQKLALAFMAAPCWLNVARAQEPEMPKAEIEDCDVALVLLNEAIQSLQRDFRYSVGISPRFIWVKGEEE